MSDLTDGCLAEKVRLTAASQYRAEDRLVVRRDAYDGIAVHQEGPGRSVYLTARDARRFALRLLRESFR